jgi:hypothetical protein
MGVSPVSRRISAYPPWQIQIVEESGIMAALQPQGGGPPRGIFDQGRISVNATGAKTALTFISPAAGRALVVTLLLSVAGVSQAAKDTIFGSEMIAANWPNTTAEDVGRTLQLTATFGGHASHIWFFAEQQKLDDIPFITSMMRQAGLKVLLQIGSVFIDTPSPPAGMVRSFGDPMVRHLFMASAYRLALTKPDYLNLCTEANLLYRFNRPEFEHFRTLYTQTYNLVKTVSPTTKVGASYLYTVWFMNRFFDNIDVPAMLTPYDMVAFTGYPEDIINAGVYDSIASMSPDWYGAARYAYPNATIGFSEIGWSSKLRGTPELQAEFVRNLPRLMSTVKPEFITWAVLHDVEFFNRSLLSPEQITFLEGLGVDINTLFGQFNGMGLLDAQGNAKPALHEAEQLVFPRK